MHFTFTIVVSTHHFVANIYIYIYGNSINNTCYFNYYVHISYLLLGFVMLGNIGHAHVQPLWTTKACLLSTEVMLW